MVRCADGGWLYFRMAQTLPIYEVMGQFAGLELVVIAGVYGMAFGDNTRCYGETMPTAAWWRRLPLTTVWLAMKGRKPYRRL